MTSHPGELSLVARAREHAERTAVLAPEGAFTYDDLLRASEEVARRLLGERNDLAEGRVALLVPPGFRYVALQWGIWRAGGVAVPMAVSHPPPELAYVLDDSQPVAAVVDPAFEERLAEAARERDIPLMSSHVIVALESQRDPGRTPSAHEEDGLGAFDSMRSGGRMAALPTIELHRRAMMLYTSGTTGRPKGVVSTHGNLEAQITALVEAWGWSAEDHILLVLPLHHVHGIVNVLSCALWSGARCQILPRFEARQVWNRIGRGDLTLFMAVPTIYAHLLKAWQEAPPEERARWTEGCRALRLMVSGSAALPVSMLERWREVSGHTLLERYGMTEIGMALSNPLHGERRPGFVGGPLPGVEVRLMADAGEEAPPGAPGEIQVRGPAVFREYWQRPKETEEAFRDGWFLTGDMAVMEDDAYRILGRRSVDIIKTGGYKVSALEVEEVLRRHPAIAECAVVAVSDPEWGERVAAALVPVSPEEPSAPNDGGAIDGEAVRAWAKGLLAPYKVPTLFLTVRELPRNAMGKVTKPAVKELFEEGADPVRDL
jgi:malonyl-CoA/methylmalonyl-CoA synthetase